MKVSSEKHHRFDAGTITLVSGGHFIHDVYTSFLAPFLPLLIDKFGLSMFLAGTLTVFLRLPSILNPFIGLVSDRVNLGLLAVWAPAASAAAMS